MHVIYYLFPLPLTLVAVSWQRMEFPPPSLSNCTIYTLPSTRVAYIYHIRRSGGSRNYVACDPLPFLVRHD